MIFISAFSIILGLVVGSFLAAFSFRLPRRISVSKGRSFCPNCKHQIAWFDNIPLFSYIILRGKCRNCKKHISFRYPLIEGTTALGFLYIALSFWPDYFRIFFFLIIYCLLVLIFIIDFERQIIPDSLVFFGTFLVLCYYIAINSPLIFPYVFSGFLASSLLMFLHIGTRGRGMGLGDVKFAVLGGMLTGFNLFLVWLFLSFLTGGIAGIILILGKKAGLKSKIAFGPFLVIGLVLTLIWGEKILHLLLLS